MKRYFIIALAFASGVSLSSCLLNLNKDQRSDGTTELEEISVNAEYSIGIPLYMTKTTSLNDEASLQFQNIFKETYVIVIDENKQEFIDAYMQLDSYDTTLSVITNYSETQVQLTASRLDVISKTDISPLKINGLNAAMAEIDANFEGVSTPVTYFLTFIEGGNKLYMIMGWTLQDKKETHRATFDQIARSFKTLNDRPV